MDYEYFCKVLVMYFAFWPEYCSSAPHLSKVSSNLPATLYFPVFSHLQEALHS